MLAMYSGGRGLQLRHLASPLLILRGVLGMVTISILYFTVIELGAGRALVINLTYPLFGSLIAAFVLKEKLRPSTIALLVLAMIGLGLFFYESFHEATFGVYDLLGLLGAVLAGVIVVVIRKLTQSETAATIYSGQCVMTVLVTLPLAAPSFGRNLSHGLGLFDDWGNDCRLRANPDVERLLPPRRRPRFCDSDAHPPSHQRGSLHSFRRKICSD